MKIFLLNLKRRKEKLVRTKKQLKKYHLIKYTQIFYAVDGLELNKKKLIQKNIIHKNFQNFTWNAGTLGSIGNYLSYYHIFNKINQNTLIIEDDIIFVENFYYLFKQILNHIEINKLEWDVIYFGISNITLKQKYKKWKKISSFEKYQILDPSFTNIIDNGDIYGMFGIYIKPNVAKIWLHNCFPMTQASDQRLASFITGIKHSIDHPTLFQNKQKLLKALVIYPPIIQYTNHISDTSL